MKSKRLIAFTLIELLVVIAIVGILSGFVLVSLNSATDSAKDVKTKNDLAAISRAILTYHALNNAYPIEETPCSIGDGTCLNELVPNHIQSFPLDFNNTRYQYSSDGTSYTLTGNLTNERVLTYDSETGFSESDAEQGLPGYAKRQPITINSASALTDYQVKLTVAYDTDMQPDFDDLRFTSSDGTTELSYWLESKTDSTTATIWVKVPSLASGDNTIYMYYANASATTASNGDNTFEFFDDFNGILSNWTITGTATALDGIITITNAGSKIVSTSNFGVNYSTKIKLRADFLGGSSSNQRSWGWNAGSLPTGYFSVDGDFPGYYEYAHYNNNWVYANLGNSWNGNYANWEIIRNSSTSIIYYINDVLQHTGTTQIPTGSLPIILKVIGPNNTIINCDWVLVRKYNTIEPTSSFGTEQNS